MSLAKGCSLKIFLIFRSNSVFARFSKKCLSLFTNTKCFFSAFVFDQSDTGNIDPLQIEDSRYHLFNGMSSNLDEECSKMDKYIEEHGGIDMMVVGIGMNGHIGFNEPGSNFDAKSHVVPLDEITSSVGQKYFSQPMKLEYGITLGFHHLLSTKKVYLIANGAAKAEVIQKAVEGEVTTAFPASVMQLHKTGYILVDEAAASLLTH
jgi:galactosamine-6-phosphate isomerase